MKRATLLFTLLACALVVATLTFPQSGSDVGEFGRSTDILHKRLNDEASHDSESEDSDSDCGCDGSDGLIVTRAEVNLQAMPSTLFIEGMGLCDDPVVSMARDATHSASRPED